MSSEVLAFHLLLHSARHGVLFSKDILILIIQLSNVPSNGNSLSLNPSLLVKIFSTVDHSRRKSSYSSFSDRTHRPIRADVEVADPVQGSPSVPYWGAIAQVGLCIISDASHVGLPARLGAESENTIRPKIFQCPTWSLHPNARLFIDDDAPEIFQTFNLDANTSPVPGQQSSCFLTRI